MFETLPLCVFLTFLFFFLCVSLTAEPSRARRFSFLLLPRHQLLRRRSRAHPAHRARSVNLLLTTCFRWPRLTHTHTHISCLFGLHLHRATRSSRAGGEGGEGQEHEPALDPEVWWKQHHHQLWHRIQEQVRWVWWPPIHTSSFLYD